MLAFTKLPRVEEGRAVQESNPHLEPFEAARFCSVKLTARVGEKSERRESNPHLRHGTPALSTV